MKSRTIAAALLSVLTLVYGARAQEPASADDTDSSHAVSFNISTSKSWQPGEAPSIHLYTHNVDALEFRVYRVNDPTRFIENLRELHSFGPEASLLGPEHIDERTWLERFHDWKAHVWYELRMWVHDQFSSKAREALRDKQSKITRKSRVLSAAEFAQVPLLNPTQLVARWRQLVPATYISDNNTLAVPKLGSGLYLVEATDGRYKAYTLLMVSQMAMITRVTPGHVMAYVVDRNTGAPIAGAKVDAGFGQKLSDSQTTDKNGLAELTVPQDKQTTSSTDNFWVVAGKDKEFAATTPSTWAATASGVGKYAGYVFTERPVYRPTHTVHWKAILREHAGNSLIVPQPASVQVVIADETSKHVFDKTMPISATGDVSGDLDLPKDAALGYYSISITPAGSSKAPAASDADAEEGEGSSTSGSVSGGFHVEEYRKPEYRVQITSPRKSTLLGATIPVTIESRYFFGEPVTNAKVKYRIYRARHYYWSADDDSDDDDSTSGGSSYGGDQLSEQTGTLNSNGTLTINVPTALVQSNAGKDDTSDADYTVEAGVTDAADREITGRARFLATYSTFRVMIETTGPTARSGGNTSFRVTTVDYDNKPVSTRVHVQLSFTHWENGESTTTLGAATDVTTDTTGHASGSLPLGTPQYRSADLTATANAVVPGTRKPVAETYLYIAGVTEETYGDTGSAQITTDKKHYAPGDVAHVTLVSEAEDYYALILATGYTAQMKQVMHSSGKAVNFDLPITQDSQPNVTVNALIMKDGQLYQAEKNIKVPPTQQQLTVTITPTKDVFQPQQQATYDVFATDFRGKPVSADFSFGVVDDAIYSLYPDSSGDIIHTLYPQRSVYAAVDSSLDYYFAGEAGVKSPMLAMRNTRFRPQLAQVKPGNEQKPKVRKAFPDTAYWTAHAHTGADGHAKITMTFPDSLTTWRATARAITASSQAGSVISRVLVRKNVLVRMGTPRFMLKGDEITLPVITHNYLDTAKQATISLKVEGLEAVAGGTQQVTIPSKGEATALFRLRASQVGTAKLTASAITDAESDALELSFPVNPAGVARTLAQSGTVAQSATSGGATITFPAGTDAAAHSLHMDVSPSIAGGIFSALEYLSDFPYGCTEQTMSSYLPNVFVAQALDKMKVPNRVNQAELKSKMLAGLIRLNDYQHDDGGWGWWKEDSSRVYMTAYIVAGIAQGRTFQTAQWDDSMLRKGVQYLHKQLDEHPRMRPELRAAVLYALAEAGETNLGEELDKQYGSRKDLEPEALAMTGLAMLDAKDKRAGEMAQLLIAKAHKEGDLVSWSSSYVALLDAEYSNNAEATAYAMRLLTHTDPNSPLLPGAAQYLMLQRNGGVWWSSTEQTAMVLFGLTDYLAASHELNADFTVDVLVNGKSVGTHHFTPADVLSGQSFTVDVPAAQLNAAGNNVQLVRRSGTGRMYWSVRGRYFSTDKHDFQSGSMSLNLTRDYYKLVPTRDKDNHVVYALQPLSGGDVQVGDVLAVHEAINGSPAKYLLLEDPIPAGAEFISNDNSYEIQSRPGGWYDWYTRREFHDDHASFFASEFRGRQEVFYLIRIVNPGTFHVSPAHVEPMYQPGVQASSDALQINVPATQPTGVQ